MRGVPPAAGGDGAPRPLAWIAPRGLAAVSFDATGTLIACPGRGAIYAEVLRRHGVADADAAACERAIEEAWREFSCAADPGRERFHDHPGGARGYWRRFLERVVVHLEVAAGSPSATRPPVSRFAAAELYDRFAQADAWTVFPDVLPTLDRLRARGLRLAVASNWDERLPGLLDRLGLAEAFETIVVSSAVGYEKPHPAIFAVVVERLGVAPGRLLHVGDNAKDDVEGALGAGVHGVLVDRRDPRAPLANLAELADAMARSSR